MSEQDDDARATLAATLGRVPSGLFILTARQGQCETGMLTSWVQQCSFNPPRLSIAVRRDRTVAGWLVPESLFALNLIGEGQSTLVSHFAKGFDEGQPAFTNLNVVREPDAPPVLADALGYLLCRVAGRCDAGDHDLFIATVVAGRILGEGKPWIHVRKNGMRY